MLVRVTVTIQEEELIGALREQSGSRLDIVELAPGQQVAVTITGPGNCNHNSLTCGFTACYVKAVSTWL